MFMYHFVFPYCDRDDHQGRPTTTKYQPQVLRKRSAVMAKKKATAACDSATIYLYVYWPIIMRHVIPQNVRKKKEDEDETKRMRVCENMVSA